jgi:CRP/FNR family transcriptional regulator, cyclic AMP receptor protein
MSPKGEEVPLEDELAAMPLFAGLTEEQVADVAASMSDRSARAGKTVIKEGHWGHELIVVLAGELEVRRSGTVVATIGPGDCVGEAAVLTLGRRNATVVARSRARLGVIEYGAFQGLLADIPELTTRVTAIARERSTQLDT